MSSSEAQNLANNLDALNANGHSYLDVSAQVAIASGAQTSDVALQIADKIKSTVKDNARVVNSYYADAQQNRPPTATQEISSFLHSTFGPKLTTENHVTKIQHDMKKAGFAAGLATNGVWDSAWTQAYYEASTAKFSKPGTGNVDAKSTTQHFLGALSSSRAANVIWQVAKSLPRDVLQIMGNVVYGVASGGSDPGTGRAIAEAFAKPENRTTSDQEYEKKAVSKEQQINDFVTVLSFLPMGTFAKGVKAATVEAKITGQIAKNSTKTTKAEKLLGKSSLTALAPAADVIPRYTFLNSIIATSKAGTMGLAMPSGRAFLNKPILNQIYKGMSTAIAKTAPIQVPIRNAIAQRLRLPVVRAANDIGLKALGFSVKEQALALAASKTGGREGSFDQTIYGLSPISGVYANALDIIGMQMNPSRLGSAKILGYEGKSADALRQSLDDVGALRAFQSANPQLDYASLVAEHGEPWIIKQVMHQLRQMAVEHATDIAIRPLILDGRWAKMNAAEREAFTTESNIAVWKDGTNPQGELAKSMQHLSIDQNAMETGFREIGAEAMSNTRAAAIARRKQGSHFSDKIEADKLMDQLLSPEYRKYLIHGGTYGELKGQIASQADDLALAQSDLASGIGQAASVPKPKMNAPWLEMNNPDIPDGMASLAVKERLTYADAKRLYNKFSDELAASDTPGTVISKPIIDHAARAKIRLKIANSLLDDFGVNIFEMEDLSAYELLAELQAQGKKLAGEIHIARDAPQEVKDLASKLDALGFKPVIGTDIGHIYTKSLHTVDLGQADFTPAAKFAKWLGVSPRLSDSRAVSARTRIETNREIQNRIDNGKIDALPGFNSSRILAFIWKGLEGKTELTPGQVAVLEGSKNIKIFNPLKHSWDLPIKNLMKANPKLTQAQAWEQIKASKLGELGLREVPRKVLREILMSPLDKETARLMGRDTGDLFMDSESADQVVQAIWQARVKVPMEMIGPLAKIEDFAQAGFYLGDKKIFGKSIMGAAEVPVRLANLRSRVRYQESVVFAFRRMFKTMAKGITENIPPTLYPEFKMEEMGISKKADEVFKRVFTDKNSSNAFLDDAEKLIREGDFYNLYSPRDSMRWASYWLEKQGYSDKEIYDKVIKSVEYGDRTAAERSLNVIFFPFSFNKTVMRQFGGYLLTHPGQVQVIDHLLTLYDENQGPEMMTWFEDNLPIIKQLEAMNALDHGIGLGGLGGINAPYFDGFKKFLTILGPKKIDYGAQATNDNNLASLKAYIPMAKEFIDLFLGKASPGHAFEGQVETSAKTLIALGQKALDKVRGVAPETDWNPKPHKLMSVAGQNNEAWEYRTRLITMLSKVLDYNYENPNDRLGWPDWVPAQTNLQGKPVTKSSIGQLVHYKYPAWDNSLSSTIAQRKATEAQRFIGEVKVKDPELGANYEKFESVAKSVSDAVSRDSVELPELAKITDAMRIVAVGLASKDANFAEFYKSHYQRLFGPLEAFKP